VWRWLVLDFLDLNWTLMWLSSLEHWRPYDNVLLTWRTPCTGGGALVILEGGVEPYMALGCLDACMEA
jgi:hypothetical protein